MISEHMPERPRNYTGQEEDKETGLLYYKARYYDPALGRFLQADSVVMPNESFGMNRYMYVSGSPVNYGDPSGNEKADDYFSRIMRDVSGGAKWAAGRLSADAQTIAKNAKGGTDGIKLAKHGLKAAKDTYDNVVFKATATRYERSDWAKAQRGVFGKWQGDINNEFWNNAIYKHKIDPENAIRAWGGSWAMWAGSALAIGMVGVGIKYLMAMQTPTALLPYAGANQWLNLGRAGYVWGGTKGFSRGMGNWNEQDARNGFLRGSCNGTKAGLAFSSFLTVESGAAATETAAASAASDSGTIAFSSPTGTGAYLLASIGVTFETLDCNKMQW